MTPSDRPLELSSTPDQTPGQVVLWVCQECGHFIPDRDIPPRMFEDDCRPYCNRHDRPYPHLTPSAYIYLGYAAE
jgi:hypothetical protein